MKKVLLFILIVFVVLGFSACDESGNGGENYYIKFVYDGTKYNLTKDIGNIPEPHLAVDYSSSGGPYALYIACNTTDSEVSIEITTDVYGAFANGTDIDEAFIRVPKEGGGSEVISVSSYEITSVALTKDETGEVTGIAEGTFTATGVSEAVFRVKVVDVGTLPVK